MQSIILTNGKVLPQGHVTVTNYWYLPLFPYVLFQFPVYELILKILS